MSSWEEILNATSGPAEGTPGGIVPVGGTAGSVLAVLHGGAGLPDVPKPFANPILLVETRVAGTKHVEDIYELAEQLEEGSRLQLLRDASNHYDHFAIRVLNERGQRLGFVPADRNEVLARLMDGGKHLYAEGTGVELVGDWWKIEMAVYLDD